MAKPIAHEQLTLPIEDLTPHPKNYRKHPPNQINEIKHSIETNGVYRNILVAQGNVILADHGVVMACQELGITEVPVYKFDIDPHSPQALKILVGDNELSRKADDNMEWLAELLQDIDDNDDLEGTGYSPDDLAQLLYRLNPTFDANDEWVGMPEFEQDEIKPYHSIKVHFESEDDLREFAELVEQNISNKSTYIYYPKQQKEDLTQYGVVNDES